MKKIITLLCLLFCMGTLQACSSSYDRDTSPGEIKQITLLQMEEMIKQEESFAIVLTQTGCGYCQDFESLLATYIKDHHVIMYDVILDQEPRTVDENLAIIDQHLEGFSSTPGIFYVEKGKFKSHLKGKQEGISEEIFDGWVQENKIDQSL